MRLAMVTAKRTKGGLWLARKAIPEDIRKAYGKREEKRSWPAALSEAQVKAELADWLAPIEARIDLLRKSSTDAPVYLTKRQCRALAGEWYQKLVETRETEFTDSITVWDWDAEIEEICPEDDEAANLIEPASYRPIPPVVDARDALLREKDWRLRRTAQSASCKRCWSFTSTSSASCNGDAKATSAQTRH